MYNDIVIDNMATSKPNERKRKTYSRYTYLYTFFKGARLNNLIFSFN